jgi:hypothetical protein
MWIFLLNINILCIPWHVFPNVLGRVEFPVLQTFVHFNGDYKRKSFNRERCMCSGYVCVHVDCIVSQQLSYPGVNCMLWTGASDTRTLYCMYMYNYMKFNTYMLKNKLQVVFHMLAVGFHSSTSYVHSVITLLSIYNPTCCYISVVAPREWNKLNRALRDAESVRKFKSGLKIHLFKQAFF